MLFNESDFININYNNCRTVINKSIDVDEKVEEEKANRIYDLDILEVSLVDKPAVPGATFKVLKSATPVDRQFIEKRCDIIKTDEEKKQVFAYVLIPEDEDLQGDVIMKEEIEKAAHSFMKNLAYNSKKGTGSGLQHRIFDVDIAYPIESFYDESGAFGVKGGWWMGMQIVNEDVWSSIKSNELTGFSIGGYLTRDIEEDEQKNSKDKWDNLYEGKATVEDIVDCGKELIASCNNQDDVSSKNIFTDSIVLSEVEDVLYNTFWTLTDAVRDLYVDDEVPDMKGSLQSLLSDYSEFIRGYIAGKSEEYKEVMTAKIGAKISSARLKKIKDAIASLQDVISDVEAEAEAEKVATQEVSEDYSDLLKWASTLSNEMQKSLDKENYRGHPGFKGGDPLEKRMAALDDAAKKYFS